MLHDLIHEAYGAMQHNRRRTALTMLGMAWGIATVVLLLAYGDGFGRACANIFANFGTRLMIMVPGRTSMQAGGQKAGVPLRFTLDDVDILTNNIPKSLGPLRRHPNNQTSSTRRGHSTSALPAITPTTLPSARSNWRRDASTTQKMRCSMPTSP